MFCLVAPGILQSDGPVEYRAARFRVRIDRVVTVAFKLHDRAGREFRERRFDFRFDLPQRVGIELSQEVVPVGAGLFDGEEPVIEPDPGGNRGFR